MKKAVLLIAVLTALGLSSTALRATTLWWGTGSTAGGGGNWDTTNAHWAATTSGPFTGIWTNANADSAVLHSNIAGGSIVITAPITMKGTLQYDQTAGTFASYTINGAQTITFNAGSVI